VAVTTTAAVATLSALPVPARAIASGAGPPPIPPVESVTEIGTVGQNPVIGGRDGTFSALVDGRSMWTFGDTVLTVPGENGTYWDDNSLSWTADLEASDGITLEGDRLDGAGAPGEFLPYTTAERRYNAMHDPDHCTAQPCGAEFAMWAGPVVADPARDRVLFFYTEVWRVAGRPGWRTVGTGIAVRTGNGPVVRPVEDPGSPTPTLMWSARETGFAGGSVVVDSTLFSYGCVPGFLVMHCEVARAPLSGVLDKSRWRYYSGGATWSPSQMDAVPVFDGGAAGNSVFSVAYMGGYMAVYSGVLSNDLWYRVASNPWGPWSDQALLFTGRQGWNGAIDYAGQAHPEFAGGDGWTQYVTYVHATGFLRSDIPLVQVKFGLPPSP
jgi:hypothetical protein